MRSPSRDTTGRLVTATVATVLLAALSPLTPAATASATASASPAHHHAVRLLDQVVAAFGQHGGAAPAGSAQPDIGLLLRRLRVARAQLDPAQRAVADQYLERPAAAAAASTSCTAPVLGGGVIASAHFCVHFATGNDAQAQLTSTTLENVYTYEVGTLGFRPPLSDGDGLLDVTLSELGNQGIYGYCTTTTSAPQSPAYCELDDDFSVAEYNAPPLNSLRVTAAHEFFHAIQFGYNADEPVWALEGTAVWAEDQVYPTINDYLQYLPFSPIREPGIPIDAGGTFERYGIVVFWKFLSEYLHDPGVIRQVWQYADYSAGGRSALQSVVAALAARGKTFGPTFARFAAWNTLPNGTYVDRLLYPSPRWALVTTLRRTAVSTGPRSVRLDHLSSSAYLITPGPKLRRGQHLRVSVDGPARATMPQALVQLRMRSGAVVYVPVKLDAAGNGTVLVSFDPRTVRSAVVTLSNASVGGFDGQPFVLRARLAR